MRAAIVGLAGATLRAEEAALLRRYQPAGVILFARNVHDPGQLTSLVASLRGVLPAHGVVAVDQEGGRVARLRPPHWRAHPAAAMLSDDALATIDAYAWPGNVREIENCMKRAVIMADGQFIATHDLGLDIEGAEPKIFNLRQVRDDAERGAVMQVLGKVEGNIARAAEMLGVSRPTLYDLMKRFGIKWNAP